MAENEFEPKILAFLCNWCSYAGADLAGISRIQYPPNIRVIRVMCSGRVDPIFVVDALLKKVDGVLVLGCHLGDCHYSDGNYEAQIKYHALHELLSFIQIENRIKLGWVSAAEGTYFGQIVTDFTNQIKKIGPNPLCHENINKNLKLNLEAIKRVVSDSRIRKLVGRERNILVQGNTYGEKYDETKFRSLLTNALKMEFLRNQLYLQLKEEPQSVENLTSKFEIDSQIIFNEILVLCQRGIVDVATIEGLNPIYKVIK